MSLVGQIFGSASSASYIRCGGSGSNSALVLAALASGFGANTSDGTYIYNLFNANTGAFTNSGFSNSSQYVNYLEAAVANLGFTNYSKIGTAAIVYGYANFQNIESSKIVQYIDNYCRATKLIFGEAGYTISQSGLEYVMGSFSLSGINSEVSQAPTPTIKKAINYNWYDSQPLFVNPNADSTLIRDIENQYYYISGELIYPSVPSGLVPCVEYYQTVNTPTGNINIRVIQNTPCYDKNSYVGPSSGTRFFRKFNDGPGSSGFFDKAMTEEYIAFDRAVTAPMDYLSNIDVIYSIYSDSSGYFQYLHSGARVDVPGRYNSSGEYGEGKTNLITHDNCCSWGDYYSEGVPFMRMHQGDNQKKWHVNKTFSYTGPNDCDGTCSVTTGLYDWTGWKFASFELDKSFAKNYSLVKMNPKMDTGRVLTRIFNLDNYSDQFGNPISPYLYARDTGDGILTCGGEYGEYVGPPQLNGKISLPGFAFYQTFDNVNFPNFATVVIRPAISNNGYSVSDFDLFSGTDFTNHAVTSSSKAKVNFNKRINSSGLSALDDIYKKCLSIGDNFGNQASGQVSVQANAGYVYTGYTYFKSGVPISSAELLLSNVEKIGSQYSEAKYVNGFTSGAKSFYMGNQYGYIITGDTSTGINYAGEIIGYSYFSNGILGSINSGWDTVFSPIPQIVQDAPYEFEKVYQTQAVENYLPRYSSGPYLTYSNQFLYPNAQAASNIHHSTTNGFPSKVNYSISLKEETVREIFIVSGIGGEIKHRYIVRATTTGTPLTLETLMATPFIANDSRYSNKYDFLKNKSLYPDEGDFFNQSAIGVDLVDKNYIPTTNFCNQIGLNSTIYNYQADQTFNQGVRYTGKLAERSIFTGINSGIGKIVVPAPIGGGLYWGYKGRVITGQMLYTPPLFDLNSYSKVVSPNLSNLVNSIYGNTAPTFSNNGSIRYGTLFDEFGQYNGKDPIFYEYVGGRSGSGANLDGGYHSSGIIGDAWYNMNTEVWGNSSNYCNDSRYSFRYPPNDKYVFLSSLTPSGLKLYGRGMSYFPYNLNWNHKPFTSSISDIGVVTSRTTFNNEYYFDFNLADQFYPARSGVVSSGIYSGLYSTGGLNIGPFDRDVELCLTGNNSIIQSGAFVIDGEILVSSDYGVSSCLINDVESFLTNSGIVLGEAARNEKLTTFKIIPSGKIANINFSGVSVVGLTGKSIVTIRPRTCLGAVSPQAYDYSSSNLSGDLGVLDSFRYINNGSEVSFNFDNTSEFLALQGKSISIMTTPRVDILYPKPVDTGDFDALLAPTKDAFGNKVYHQKNPTLSYWTTRNPYGLFTGIRETTRIHVSIDSISSELSEAPYQTYRIIIPSGECVVSGSFGYTGQAESSIVSDGIILSGITGASSLSGIFEPIYVSDVLQRIPSGVYQMPSGSGSHSIFEAPSLMKTRKNPYIISGNDAYVNIFPLANSNYNAFLWPAWSDLALLNPEVVYEQMPPYDGNVFLGSYLTFSASQGQSIGTGFNPKENVTYRVPVQFSMFDSISTNAIYNQSKCIVSGVATKITLNSGDLSGILTSEGNSLTMAINLKS